MNTIWPSDRANATRLVYELARGSTFLLQPTAASAASLILFSLGLMSRSHKQPFPRRGVLLFTIAFALIGLAIRLRSHDAVSSSTQWLPTVADRKLLLVVFFAGLLIVLAAFFGSWFGYLRVALRLRKFSKTHDHKATRTT